MRLPFGIILVITVLLAGTYWYYEVEAVCGIPLEYTVGNIAPQFNLSEEEARLAITEAENLWEEATGEDLFTYDPGAAFSVNFIFDERHAFTDAEQSFKDRLSAAEEKNRDLREEHASLLETYESIQELYDEKVAVYDTRLADYNAAVGVFNVATDPAAEEFERLEREQQVLDDEREEINTLVSDLQQVVNELNEVSETGNQFIETYNRNVDVYNKTFGDGREFTQGDYQRKEINIYTYKDKEELVLVLAHELGHALSIGHVENESSVMHSLIGGQSDPLALSAEDLAGFEAICGDTRAAFFKRLKYRLGL